MVFSFRYRPALVVADERKMPDESRKDFAGALICRCETAEYR